MARALRLRWSLELAQRARLPRDDDRLRGEAAVWAGEGAVDGGERGRSGGLGDGDLAALALLLLRTSSQELP